MAEILTAQRDYDAAQRHLRGDLCDKPEMLRRLHALRGKIFAATGHSTEAISELLRVIDHDEDGSLNYVLARQYQKLGDEKSAALAFERYRRFRPQ